MSPDPSSSAETVPSTRTGYVVLAGRPNVGKSTLLNALVGRKLSIVTPRAQTTWQRVTGIRTDERTQMIFLDTPGLLEVRDLLQRSMLEAALEALGEADVVLLVLDATRDLDDAARTAIRDALEEADAPLLVAVNKVDAAPAGAVDDLIGWSEEELEGRSFPVSALRGDGVEDLLGAVQDALPPGPFLYPADDIASQPVRFFVAELVRESVFQHYRQEIPYSVVCRVEEFRETQDPVYIGVTVYVERQSQKGIVVGKKGRAIRELGTTAREKIEHFLGHSVYLDLWVKTLSGWRRKRRQLARLGFHVSDDGDK